MYGFIFNIQRFCINDGPGIRKLCFLRLSAKVRVVSQSRKSTCIWETAT